MDQQNKSDAFKEKLLQYWAVFLSACGKFWNAVKKYAKNTAVWVQTNGKILLQKLAAWLLKAKEWILATVERLKDRFGSQKAEAVPTEPVEKAVPETLEEPAADVTKAVAESPAEEAVPAVTEEVPAAAEPIADDRTWQEKVKAALVVTGRVVKKILKWLWRLRKVFLAAPVLWAAIKLARENMERLPEQVGLDIQSTGEFARMITRQQAVYWPLGITMFCLLLMLISRKPALPWVVSVFTLVLPWIIWILNFYA